MRGITGAILLATLLGGCGSKEEATPTPAASTVAVVETPAASKPDLAACAKAEPSELQRTRPLAVPKAFGDLAASDLHHFAIVTATGATVCVDTSWIETIHDAKASPDGRFFAFGWNGYEAGGYVVVDRTGKGQVIDTGVAPLAPPSGHRFAAVEISASGFGSLNAFAVWDILPVGLKEIAHYDDLPDDGEWRTDGWQGDGCVKLSYVPSERIPERYEDLPKVAGDPWFASEKNRWKPMAGPCPTT